MKNQAEEVIDMWILKEIQTHDLLEELKTREGVRIEYAEPHQDKTITVNGPAIVLVVTD